MPSSISELNYTLIIAECIYMWFSFGTGGFGGRDHREQYRNPGNNMFAAGGSFRGSTMPGQLNRVSSAQAPLQRTGSSSYDWWGS